MLSELSSELGLGLGAVDGLDLEEVLEAVRPPLAPVGCARSRSSSDREDREAARTGVSAAERSLKMVGSYGS